MGTHALPDMYALSPRACGPRASGIHIRQSTRAHVITLYTAKLLSGKTFVVVHKIHNLLENFCGASGRGHHVLYTVSDSRRKLLRLTEKCENFPT